VVRKQDRRRSRGGGAAQEKGSAGRDGGVLWCTSSGRAGLLFAHSKEHGVGQKVGGHGGLVQEKKGAMAAILWVVCTAQGRQPGQHRLGLAERCILAAHACE
jgi:hypothetical protein